jgi:hypothetical protein
MAHTGSHFPSTTGFTTLDFTSNQNTRVTVAVSGKTQRLQTGSQYWSFSLKSPKKTRADVMSDYAFLVAQNGQASSFTITPPEIASTRGTASGTITINDTYGAGGSTVKGNGASGTLKKGDVIKFSNHDKVYMIMEDVDMDISSEDSFEIHPPLVTDIDNTTTITYNNVPFKVYLTGDNIRYATSTDGLYQYEIKVNEEI